jgi:hypothetical protein
MARDGQAAGADKEEAFERARFLVIVASVMTAAGLGIAGTVDKTAGGVIVLAAWVFGVFSLHKLGRAGG